MDELKMIGKVVLSGLIFVVLIGCLSMLYYSTLSTEQKTCEHNWHELEHKENLFTSDEYTIFCTKCKLEEVVDESTWNRIQIDPDYELYFASRIAKKYNN